MNIQWRKMALPLKERFKISHTEFDELEHLLLIIEDEGVTAFGEIVPISFFNESLDRAMQEAADIASRHLTEKEQFTVVEDVQKFILTLAGENYLKCTVCGFEMVLLDYMGKLHHKPVWSLLNLENPRRQTIATTLPFKDGGPAAQAGLEKLELIKLKLGGPNDVEGLEFVRNHTNIHFILDMNQGWTVEEAARYKEYLRLKNILWVEEPVKFKTKEQLQTIKNEFVNENPLFLDDSISDLSNIIEYSPYIDGVNLKLVKLGGIFQTLRAVEAAKERKLKLMLGCFLESSLSIAYACHIASLFDYVDLDGSTFIKQDPFSGLTVTSSSIQLSERGYGIGVEYTKRSEPVWKQ